MATNLFNRYIWLIDTLRRYGRLTRTDINRLWRRSALCDGHDMPRRTFYNYRNAVSELFGINIECDPATYEYYIAAGDNHSASVTDWMLNSVTVGNMLGDASDVAGRIFVEDVPSARQYLGVVIKALKENRPVHFSYLPYTRINTKHDIVVEPYFLKIFRQRWYLTGRNTKDDIIKTYALDRMSNVTLSHETFAMPDDFDADAYCNDAFGIVFTQGRVRDITIKVDARQAKYFRALPLHHSQQESVHDTYSIFHYRMKLTGDLVEAILSYGAKVTVLSPPELRAWVQSDLKDALDNYAGTDTPRRGRK